MDSMLGRLIRLIVKVPSEMLGALCDLVEKLASHRGNEYYERLKLFLRDELPATVKEVITYLRRLFTFMLGGTNGKDTYAMARKVFRTYFSPDFESQGIVFSGIASETEITVNELVHNGKFTEFLGNTAVELEKRRLLGSQFLKICRDNPDKLCDEGYSNFFVLTKGDEVVAEDLSNVFVANVSEYGSGKLETCLYHVSFDYFWDGFSGRRIFYSQQ